MAKGNITLTITPHGTNERRILEFGGEVPGFFDIIDRLSHRDDRPFTQALGKLRDQISDALARGKKSHFSLTANNKPVGHLNISFS